MRRSGRDNREGIAYSMTQWYPKIAAYDERGWHADPYVAREFYGEFGDFDVQHHLDSSFTVAATGVLQNPQEIGHGYATPGPVMNGPAATASPGTSRRRTCTISHGRPDPTTAIVTDTSTRRPIVAVLLPGPNRRR